MSGNKPTMSLLLMVMLATIFLRAIFFWVKFLSFLLPLFSSRRSSATLPCRVCGKLMFGGIGYATNMVAVIIAVIKVRDVEEKQTSKGGRGEIQEGS